MTACARWLKDPLSPTMSPWSLMPFAALKVPPGSVPRSVIRPSCQRNACVVPSVVLQPTTSPWLLMAVA